MADARLNPRPETPAPSAPAPEAEYHCPNCLPLEDPTSPDGVFWACQNLCIRE